MWIQPQKDQSDEELFLAGERVPAGLYREVETGREIQLREDDTLPASLDGHVAAYTIHKRLYRE